MKKFIHDNVFQVIISFLLTIIVSMGVYFIHKVEVLEDRIWAVELENPGTRERITALDQKVDQCVDTLKEKIDSTEKHLSDKMDTQYNNLKELIQER